MLKHLLFRFSRAYRANCIMARVLEYDRANVRLTRVPGSVSQELRLAA